MLLTFIIASLILPVFQISHFTNTVVSDKLTPIIPTEKFIKKAPVINSQKEVATLYFMRENQSAKQRNVNRISSPNILLYIYLGGGIISLLLLLRNIFLVLLIFKNATIQKMKDYRQVIVEQDVPSFAFMRSVVISKNDYENHAPYILTHEKAHIKFFHFYDLFLLEIIKIIHWFNPVIYLIIKDLKQIHEFQADEYTIRSGLNTTQYQLLIIKKSVGIKRYVFANSFNQCQIKTRITMINNPKKLKTPKWKIFMFFPLAALLIYTFSACSSIPETSQNSSDKILGTWELISYKYGGDSELHPASGKRIKIITGTTFCWMDIKDPMPLVSDMAGGTYSYSNNSYIENIEYGMPAMIPYVGKEQKFTVTINEDTLNLKGSLSTGEKIEEIWVKLYAK
jgi:beta-lactamase regulating signal transducer with metallopeptidase domain